MNKQNYHLKMLELIRENCSEERVPKLLIHSCCAPCSSYCLELLSQHFEITVFYYNPNIYPPEEYHMRAAEQERFVDLLPTKHKISFVEGAYDTEKFYHMARGMEDMKEGQERCFACYELRLRETFEYAKNTGFDFVTTTLSISPLKNSMKLNEIGGRLEEEYGIPYLYSDFKKQNGYKRSTEISNEYDMYRQYYCGCVFSKKQRDDEIAARQMDDECHI